MQIHGIDTGALPGRFGDWRAPAPTTRRGPSSLAVGSDRDFVSMLGAYRRSGGLARADEVVSLLDAHCGLGVATLARWIVEGRLVCFEWDAQTWLPWFQFKHLDRLPDPAVGAACAELAGAYDEWELAQWFARPNALLAGCAPTDRLADDPDAVLQVARADRFVVKG
jgi:hypothetical protein